MYQYTAAVCVVFGLQPELACPEGSPGLKHGLIIFFPGLDRGYSQNGSTYCNYFTPIHAHNNLDF